MKAANWMVMTALGCSLAACGGGGTSTGTTGVASSNFAARSGLSSYKEAKLEEGTAALSTANHMAFIDLLAYSVIESNEKADGYVLGNVWRPVSDSAVPTVRVDGSITPPKELSPDVVGNGMITMLETASKAKARAQYGNSGTMDCAGGGNVVVTGTLDTNTTQGELNVQYSSCIDRSGYFRRQGVATVFVNARDATNGTFTDFTINYDGLSVETPWNYFVYTGSQHVVRTLINGDYKKSLVETDLKRDDQNTYTYLDSTQNTVSGQGQSISGRLCHGNYGCVEVSTAIPFNFSARTGEINLKGANNSTIQLFYDKGALSTRLSGDGKAYGAPIPL